MWTCTVLAAVAGARSPQSSSISRSVPSVSLACSSSSASRARCLPAASTTGWSSSRTSSGPRMRKSMPNGEAGASHATVPQARSPRQPICCRSATGSSPSLQPPPCTIGLHNTTGRTAERLPPDRRQVMGQAISATAPRSGAPLPLQGAASDARRRDDRNRRPERRRGDPRHRRRSRPERQLGHPGEHTKPVGARPATTAGPRRVRGRSSRAPRPGVRFDGGPEEGTRGVLSSPRGRMRCRRSAMTAVPRRERASLTKRSAPATFDPNSIKSPPGVRYDGGPEEGTRGPGH